MKQLTKPADPKPARITKAILTEWEDLEERRLELKRQADDLAKQQAIIERDLFATVLSKGGSTRRIETCGFELSIESKRGSVSWKPEFIRVAGQAAADELIRSAPMKDSLAIRKL